MEYFDLPSSTIRSQYWSSATPQPAEYLGSLEHATIDGQEKIPTPVSTPLDHPAAVSVSTAFHPSFAFNGAVPDIILVSTDNVHFYVHRRQILAASANQMGGHISSEFTVASPPPVSRSPQIVHIPNASDVANVVLHTMYGLSCLHYFPTFDTVDTALDALSTLYGVAIQKHAMQSLPLYELIISFAPFRPLDTYALAGHYALEDLAVAASSHLLAYDLSGLPDTAVQKMGPIYLKRLFLLHPYRLRELRHILHKTPATHPPTPICSQEAQQRMIRSWAFVVAQLVWDVVPKIVSREGVSTNTLQSLFEPIGATVTCPSCLAALHQRVQEIIHEWSAVKRTI